MWYAVHVHVYTHIAIGSTTLPHYLILELKDEGNCQLVPNGMLAVLPIPVVP